jgi:hypothetical protein
MIESCNGVIPAVPSEKQRVRVRVRVGIEIITVISLI